MIPAHESSRGLFLIFTCGYSPTTILGQFALIHPSICVLTSIQRVSQMMVVMMSTMISDITAIESNQLEITFANQPHNSYLKRRHRLSFISSLVYSDLKKVLYRFLIR